MEFELSEDSFKPKEPPSLQEILRNSEYSSQFKSFLEKNLCSENYFFWCEVNFYKGLFTRNLNEDEQKKILHQKAIHIFEIFLSEDATSLVNISAIITKKIKYSLAIWDQLALNSKMSVFDEAQNHAFSLMLEDSYPKFLTWWKSQKRGNKNREKSKTFSQPSGWNLNIPNASNSIKSLVKKLNLLNASKKEESIRPDWIPENIDPNLEKEISEAVLSLLHIPSNDNSYEVEGQFLTNEYCTKLHEVLKTEPGRRIFVLVLNQERSSKVLSNISFEILWRLFKVALFQCEINSDYVTAKHLLHMSSTYYRNLDSVHDYIYNNLHGISIWRDPRFWEFVLYDTIASERDKLKSMKDWRQMNAEEQIEFNAQEKGIVFGQLGGFAMHMLTMGLPIEEVRQFINKQCLVNGLPESQSEALIGSLDKMYSSIKEQETSRQYALETQKWVQYQNPENLSSENEARRKKLLQDQTEQAEAKCKELEINNQNIETYLNNLSELVSWSQNRNQLQRTELKTLFESIHQLLDKKEKETLEAIDQNEKNFIENIQGKNKEIQQLRQSNSELIKQFSKKQMDETLPEVVRDIDLKIRNTSLFKPDQVSIMDYGLGIEHTLTSIYSLLESLNSNLHLNLYRWKITNFSKMLNSAVEFSPYFEYSDFNWRILIHPNAQKDSNVSLFLEFLGTESNEFSLTVNFVLRIINLKDTYKKREANISYTFVNMTETQKVGEPNFMNFSDLYDLDNGWVVNNSVIFEVEFLSLVKFQ